MPADAHELRQRAIGLRRLADHLDATPLADVAARGGPDTWISPRASALHDQLDVDRRRLADAADDLRHHARYLDRQAEAADVAALVLAAR